MFDFEIFLYRIFFPGDPPPGPFGFRTLMETGSCSTAFQQKVSTFFHRNFFLLKIPKKKFKSSKTNKNKILLYNNGFSYL